MALIRPLFELSEVCSMHGIEHAIICPGSRSASLAIAFNRNPKIKTQVIADERSAAFVALGIATVTKKPTVLICTSGSAVYNFAPAVAEAFFQEVPLLILSADRPPEWINQYDGQTIFQESIFGKHVKFSFTYPVDKEHNDSIWHANRIANQAINLCKKTPLGPVHINIPIRDPFYPKPDETYTFGQEDNLPRVIIESELTTQNISLGLDLSLNSIIVNAKRPLLIVGQQDEDLDEEIQYLSDRFVVIADAISNVGSDRVIRTHDFISKKQSTQFPDLVISLGKSLISKELKIYLRSRKDYTHIHVQNHPETMDVFQNLQYKIQSSPRAFLKSIQNIDLKAETSFYSTWHSLNKDYQSIISSYTLQNSFGQLSAFKEIIQHPNIGCIHVGNSMPVRYLNYVWGLRDKKSTVYANRGTSGIDGTVSTAIGQAQMSQESVTCIVGDVAFFYDSNALYLSELPSNLRIILMNNGGGQIFRQIKGPSETQELEDFFVTKQTRTAKSMANELGIAYFTVKTTSELNVALEFKHACTVIEVFLDGKMDVEILKGLFHD
ncbi:MAG: 2-succinyl-5-enolpyruvyl-6-hydroxy-3-cyclohexene-1-carboxylic-acid synthase [Leadbetterella sp.]